MRALIVASPPGSKPAATATELAESAWAIVLFCVACGAVAGAREQHRGRGARGAGADDDRVVVPVRPADRNVVGMTVGIGERRFGVHVAIVSAAPTRVLGGAMERSLVLLHVFSMVAPSTGGPRCREWGPCDGARRQTGRTARQQDSSGPTRAINEEGHITMTITHDMTSVRRIADRVAMLHEGVIQWEGPAAEIDKGERWEPAELAGLLDAAMGLAILARLPERLQGRVAGLGIAAPYEMWTWHEEMSAPKDEIDAWRTIDIRADVAAICPWPVYFSNDITAACAAEPEPAAAPPDPAPYLFAWAYDVDGRTEDTNFLAVITNPTVACACSRYIASWAAKPRPSRCDGTQTTAAVRYVQTFHRITADGDYGPNTRAAMTWPKYRNGAFHHC